MTDKIEERLEGLLWFDGEVTTAKLLEYGQAMADALAALRTQKNEVVEREVIRNALYEGLCWFGTLPEPQGDVPERYHRWDDLGEFADRIAAAIRNLKSQDEPR